MPFWSGILKACFPWRSPEGPAFWEPCPLGTEFSKGPIFWKPYLLKIQSSESLSLATLPPDIPISRGSTFWRLHLLGALLPEVLLPPEGLTSWESVPSSADLQQGCSDFHNGTITRSYPYLIPISPSSPAPCGCSLLLAATRKLSHPHLS